MTAQPTDETLMLRARAGRADALEALIRRHAVGLMTFLRRTLGPAGDCDELFQEVFLLVWRKRATYTPGRPFRPWLYAVAVNRCREFWRGRPPEPEPLTHDPPADPVEPDANLRSRETAEQVADALSRLTRSQRAVVALRVWEELPYADIADALGCSEATARSHMAHALAGLRRLLLPLAEA